MSDKNKATNGCAIPAKKTAEHAKIAQWLSSIFLQTPAAMSKNTAGVKHQGGITMCPGFWHS